MNPKYSEGQSISRYNIRCGFYASMALRNYAEAKKMMPQSKELFCITDGTQRAVEERVAICVVFSALAAESFLNDYAARYLGDKVFHEDFDTLSVPSKLQLISLLLFEKPVDKGGHLYALLKTSIRLRNEYVHNKSVDASKYLNPHPPEENERDISADEEFRETNDYFYNELKNDLRQAYDALKMLAALVRYIDDHDENALAKFLVFGCSGMMCEARACDQGICDIIQQLYRACKP